MATLTLRKILTGDINELKSAENVMNRDLDTHQRTVIRTNKVILQLEADIQESIDIRAELDALLDPS